MIFEVLGVRRLHNFYLIENDEVFIDQDINGDYISIEGNQYYEYSEYKVFLKSDNKRYCLSIDASISVDYTTHIEYFLEINEVEKFGGITHRPSKKMFIDLKICKYNSIKLDNGVISNELFKLVSNTVDYYLSDYLSFDLSSFRQSVRYRPKPKVWLFACDSAKEKLIIKSSGINTIDYDSGNVFAGGVYVTAKNKIDEFRSNLYDKAELVLVNCDLIVKDKGESSITDKDMIVNVLGFKENDTGFDFVLSNNSAIILDNGQLTYEKDYMKRPDRFFDENIEINVRELFTKYFNGEEELITSRGFKLFTHNYFTGDGYDTIACANIDRSKVSHSSNKYNISHLPIVFMGDSSAGKSYLSENITGIFDTDLKGSLPDYFKYNTVTVVGNLNKFSLEDIKDKCSLSTLICDFSIIGDKNNVDY